MDILNANFVQEMIEVTTNMYRLGWDERNGGNISYLLCEEEVRDYIDITKIIRKIPLNFGGSELKNKYFITTGSGKYFKNVEKTPSDCLGIFRISESGNELELLWGFDNGGVPTSELPSHLMSHITRLKVDPENRVVMHCHATHLLAMTYVHSLDARDFTRTLWKMCTECIVVFPDGIEVIPWMVPGTTEIGKETSEKMKESRLVIWPFHGVYGSGKNLDEVFGLIETAEKAAQIYYLVNSQGSIKQSITDINLQELSDSFNVTPKEGYLEL